MKKYIVGIDVGGTNVKLGLVNSAGEIIARSHLPTKTYSRDKKRLIQAIINAVDELLTDMRLSRKNVEGVGIGLPGLIDPIEGVVRYLPNIPGWRNVPLQKIMQEQLGVPVYLENDVNMITLAEWKYGAGQGQDNFICITLGTGVGGGLILNGSLYRGEGFVAGEIGHMPLEDRTLEAFVGNAHLQEKAGRIFKNKNIRLEEVFDLAKVGNVRAIEFWDEAGTHIGTTLAGVLNLLNLRLIVIGGGVSANFRFIAPAIKKTIKARAMKVQASMVKVVRTKLLNDAGIVGAQILVKELGVKK